jgi:pilus assembly protein Flp/PilA
MWSVRLICSQGRDIMMNLITQACRFVRDEAGQDLLEYALLVAFIALVVVAALDESGEMIRDVFNNVANQLAAVV